MRQRATADVLVQLLSRVVNLALGLVVTGAIARLLGNAGYGQWSTILLVYPMVGLLLDLGLSAVVVREAAADPENESEWISALLLVQAVMVVPATVVALVVVVLVHEGSEMLIAGLLLLPLMPVALGGAVGAVFKIRIRNGVPMAVLTANSVAWMIAVIAIKEAGGGMVELAIAMTTITTITTGVQTVIALRLVKLHRPRRESVYRLIRVGAPIALASMLVLAYGRIDHFLVFTIAGSRDAGLYGAVYRVMEAWTFIPGSLLTTLSPLLAASWPANRDRLLEASRTAFEYLAIGSLGILAFVIPTSDQIVRVIFGEDFAAAAPALVVLAGAFVVISYGYLTDNLLLVLNQQRKLMYIALAGLVFTVSVNLVVIPRYGFLGAAWATLATEIFVEVLALRLVMRGLGVHRLRLGRLVRILLAAAALVVALEGCDIAGVPLVGLMAAAVVLYPALLIGFRAIRIDEIAAIVLRRNAATV